MVWPRHLPRHLAKIHLTGHHGGWKVLSLTEEEMDGEIQRLDHSGFSSCATGGPEQTEVDELSAASSLVSPL